MFSIFNGKIIETTPVKKFQDSYKQVKKHYIEYMLDKDNLLNLARKNREFLQEVEEKATTYEEAKRMLGF